MIWFHNISYSGCDISRLIRRPFSLSWALVATPRGDAWQTRGTSKSHRGFCAAQGYAPEDSLGRHFRKDKDIEAPNRFQYLAPSGRCWDVLEARGNHWRGMDPALWREWDPALWRDLSTWWRCCCKVHMISKRDSDVPTVCQASPRGVATKAIVEADLRFNRAQGGNRRGACRFINC